ncbi:MAG: FeoB-associated Cys-rich membrane protein [Dorea sp.]|nr:FeoB-associated Cys-rich membrane protein [Dorea sp.]
MALAASSVLSTAVIGLMVLGAAALAARSIWKNKKNGGGCGCGCENCPGSCHNKR